MYINVYVNIHKIIYGINNYNASLDLVIFYTFRYTYLKFLRSSGSRAAKETLKALHKELMYSRIPHVMISLMNINLITKYKFGY